MYAKIYVKPHMIVCMISIYNSIDKYMSPTD